MTTWQETLFEIPPSLVINGVGDVPLEIKGEPVPAEPDDWFEARVFIKVLTNTVGDPKMSAIGDSTGEKQNERRAGVVKAFTELVRRVPAAEVEDMRKAELLQRYREAEEAAGVRSIRPA